MLSYQSSALPLSLLPEPVLLFGKLSVLQPMLSLNYVLSIVLAAIVLKEKVSLVKCIGVLIIIGGVIMIVGGDEE